MSARPKSGSKADRDALRAEMAASGASTATIAIEMRSRWGMRPREAWRLAHGWSLQEVADRLNTAAESNRAAAITDASQLGKWEKWPAPASRRPSLAILALLAEVYGCTVADLLDLEDYRNLPEPDLRVLRQAATPAAAPQPPVAAAVPQPEPDGARLVLASAQESATWAAWAEGSNIGDIALEQLLADIRGISAAYLVEQPMPLFQRTRQLRDRVFRLLEGHQPPRQAADLYIAAGYLCSLLAWMSSDLGHLQAADTQGRTAWLCAELSGNDGLRAWVLSTRSKIAFWDGRYRDAIAHASRGAGYVVPGTAAVLLACQEADAWAELGAVEEARAALGRVDYQRERQRGHDDIGGLFSCSPFRTTNYIAGVHLRTGQPHEALAEAEAALRPTRGEPVRAYGTVAQMHLGRASAHAAIGSADGVLEAVLPVLAMPLEQRLDTVTVRLQQLARTVARSSMADTVPARELQGTVEVYARESVSHLALSPSPAGPAWITG